MLEKDIERNLTKKIENLGGLCLKYDPKYNNGMPDRLIILPFGQVWFVELKQEGKKPRPLQEYQINRLRNLKQRVYVIDSKKAIDVLISDIKKERIKSVDRIQTTPLPNIRNQ